MVEGRCLCGEHAYAAEGPPSWMHHCHCVRCQKSHGVAFSTMVAVPAAGFRYVQGGGDLRRFAPARISCRTCASPLPTEPMEGLVFVPAGQLAGDPGVRPEAHIWVSAHAPWYEIEDDLPRHEGFAPGREASSPPTPESPDAPGDGARGSCLCGAVRFRLRRPPVMARHCHCSRCRKARGAAHASNLVLPLDGVETTRGAQWLREYRLPEARFFAHAFCERCGSSLPRLDTGRGIAIVPLGSLDDPPPMRPADHIWAASKADWYDIPGGLPMHPGAPPG